MIDYENTTPLEVVKYLKSKGDTDLIQRIFKANVLKQEGDKVTIPSYYCTITKNEKPRKANFPFFHQVFWYSLAELKDIKFAISEVERITLGEGYFTFPNGTMVQLDK